MPSSGGTIMRSGDNASTATALAADPSACGAGEFVNDIAANGSLTCATPSTTLTGLTTITNTLSSTGTLELIGDGIVSQMLISRYQGSSGGNTFAIRKARGSLATPATVSAGDAMSDFNHQAHDGTAFRTLAQIRAFVDTVGGTDDLSSYMIFTTRNDGAAASATERMRIHKAGEVSIGNGLTAATKLDVDGAVTSRPKGTSSGDTGQLCMRELAANGTNVTCLRAADSTADINFTMPSTACTGTVLSTAGVLSCSTTTGSTSSTEWASYTPTISAGFGTTADVSFKWRRVGDTIEVAGSFTDGTIAASLGTFTLPNSHTIDATKLHLAATTTGPCAVVGEIWVNANAANTPHGTIVACSSTSTSLVYSGASYTSVYNTTPVNVSTQYYSNTNVQVRFSFPASSLTNSN